MVPFTHFALLADRYMDRSRASSAEQVARVALKNHANGARNPFAQRQQVRTLDEMMAERRSRARSPACSAARWGRAPPPCCVVSDDAVGRSASTRPAAPGSARR